MPTPEILVHPHVLPKITIAGGLRLREDTVFTDASGAEKSAIRKRAEKDLQLASEVLSRLLLPSEAVLYVARGAFMPNNWEQLMENHGAMALGALLVVTNQRLIVLRTKLKSFGGWAWDQGLLTVEWTSLVEAAKKGWLIGYLDLKDQANHRERFFRLGWRDTKKLRLLLGVLVPQVPGLSAAVAPGSAPGFASLCPKCLAKLSADLYRCAQCGQVFKDEKSLLGRTLLIPGGSYFYTGQTAFGILAGLVEGLFTLAVLVSALEGLGVIAPSEDTRELALVRAGVWLAMLVFIKFVAYYRARRRVKRFIPA